MDIETLSAKHQAVWTCLEQLEDGERILGYQLMARTGIKDKRIFHQVIHDLRQENFLIGSGKHLDDRGYYQIRTEEDLERTVNGIRDTAYNLLTTASRIEKSFNHKEYGNLLEFEGIGGAINV